VAPEILAALFQSAQPSGTSGLHSKCTSVMPDGTEMDPESLGKKLHQQLPLCRSKMFRTYIYKPDIA